MRIYWSFILVLGRFIVASSSASRPSSPLAHKLPLHGLRPDPFVQAAPLIVAVVCKDGIAIIAAHTFADEEESQDDNNNDEIQMNSALSNTDPLLYYRPEQKKEPSPQQNEPPPLEEEEDDKIPFLDLPQNYGGPFRIHAVDKQEAVITATGWRADCHTLTEYCHTLVDHERKQLGVTARSIDTYRRMATDLSYFMTSYAVSDGYRPLSCVGLLASCSSSPMSDNQKSCCLWLLDSTGAYPVRAHCVGGGNLPSALISTEEPSLSPRKLLISDWVNERLRKEYFTSTSSTKYGFEDLTVQEGLKRLLLLLANKDLEPPADPSVMRPPTISALQANTRLELAIIDAKRHLVVRKHLRDLRLRVNFKITSAAVQKDGIDAQNKDFK